MCGIAGVYGDEAVKKSVEIIIGQWNRGTEGAGIAWIQDGVVEIKKTPTDQVSFYEENKYLIDVKLRDKMIAIAHNRRPAGSEVAYRNTHPFLSEDKSFALIHNGVLWRLKPVITYLKQKGHKFEGETDSEVAMHVLEEFLERNNGDYVLAMEELGLFFESRGSFAFLIITSEGNIYGVRNRHPIRIVHWGNDTYVCSDEQALSNLGVYGMVEVFEPRSLNVMSMEDGECYVYGDWEKELVTIMGRVREEPPYSVSAGYVMRH